MLSKEETAFIDYWERNRLRRKKVVRQFLLGVPIGLLFAVPIVINLFSRWDKHADMEANGPDFDPRVLFVALLLIVGFTSIFWQRHKWDQYEQRYLELLARRERERQRAAGAVGDPAVPAVGGDQTMSAGADAPGAATHAATSASGAHSVATQPMLPTAEALGTDLSVSARPVLPAADPETGLPAGLERESSHSHAHGPDESPAE